MRLWHKVALLGGLYFAQGLPFGFFTKSLPALMRQMGAPLELIGLSSALFLPWALKFLWAPFVDRHYWPRVGRRRSWLLPMQAAMMGLLALMALWRPGMGLAPLMVVVVLVNLVSATQDIAADGLAVSVLDPAERPLGNALQVGAYRIGMIASGGLLLGLIDHLGWTASFALMVGLVALSSLPTVRLREPAPEPAPNPTHPNPAHDPHPLRGFLRAPHGWAILGLLTAYKFGNSLGDAMLKPFMIDLGLSLSDIGWISGTGGSVAGLAGAALGGLLTRRLGQRRALVIFAIVQAITWAAVAAYPSPTWGALLTLVCAEHVASGLGTVALFTCMMDWVRPHHAATDYTLQASAVVISTGLASMLSGFLARPLGYPLHFTLSAALCLAAAPLAASLYPPNTQEKRD